MPTKPNTAPKQSPNPAVPQIGTAQPKTEVSTDVRPPKPLTDLQALICDELADMLVGGGNEETVDQMINAAVIHKWERWERQYQDDPAAIQASVDKHAPTEFRVWKLELIAERARNRKAPPAEQIEPEAAAVARSRRTARTPRREHHAGHLQPRHAGGHARGSKGVERRNGRCDSGRQKGPAEADACRCLQDRYRWKGIC